MDFYVGQKVRPTKWKGNNRTKSPQWFIDLKAPITVIGKHDSGAYIISIEIDELPIRKVSDVKGEYVGLVDGRQIEPLPVIQRF